MWIKIKTLLVPAKTFLFAHVGVVFLLVVIVVLAFGGVKWCRRTPIKPVEVMTQPGKDKIDRATEDRLRKLLSDRERDLANQRAENDRLRKAAEAKVTVPFETAAKGGTNAMAELATVWTAPGTAEQLRARWRAPTDPANPGR